MIPLSVPYFCGNELKYITEAVVSEWVSTGGPFIEKFERSFSNYVGSATSVACQSGTAAIHLALQLSGVTAGELVLVPTLTFIAAVNPVKYLGADPIFIDCDDTLCMDPEKLKSFLLDECEMINDICIHKSTKKIIRTILVVHVFGNLADLEAIVCIANQFGLKIVEDATEALGSNYKSGPYEGVAAGLVGDFGAFSFNGNKIMTTGGGGMLVSKNMELSKKARYLSTQAKDDELYYIHNEIGYNYRMTNLQAALGLAQLESMPLFIENKKKNYNLYKKGFKDLKEVEMLDFAPYADSNCWFYSLLIKGENFEKRDRLIRYLQENSIQTRPIWGLISDQKPYISSLRYQIEKATYYHDRVINIPCSTNLNKQDIDEVIRVVKMFFNNEKVPK